MSEVDRLNPAVILVAVDTVDELLSELKQMRSAAVLLQSEASAAAGDANARAEALRGQYERWYASAVRAVDPPLRDQFRNMYEGGSFTTRIKGFLADPFARNVLWTPEAADFTSKWRCDVNQTFVSSLDSQRALLVESAREEETALTSSVIVVNHLAVLMRRLPVFLHQMNQRRNGEPVTVTNEYDFQDVLEAVLRLHFDDVRPEEPTASTAGSAARTDFLLWESGVVVEAKMTRPSLSNRKLRDEVIIDQKLYRAHERARALVVLVYDPDRRVANPTAFETDLNEESGELPTRVVVIAGR